MLVYYIITTVLSAIGLIILIGTYEPKKTNYYFMILMLLMAIANGGYLALALSGTLSEAVLANKVVYLGGCFLPLIWLLMICALCNYPVARWMKNILYAYSILVYGMVLSIGYSDFYYSEMALEKYQDITVLGHTYGPGHKFFYVILYGYIIIQIVLLVYSLIKKKAVSRKNLWALIIMEIANISSFIIGRSLNAAIEIMPVLYVIDGMIILYLHHRGIMYNIEDNIMESFSKQETYGYIMLDKRYNYLGCNEVVKKILPATEKCTIDNNVKSVAGMECVLEWLTEYVIKGTEQFEYEYADRHYEVKLEQLRYQQKARGYMIEFREDTDKWNYVKLLSEHNRELQGFQEELEIKVEQQTEEIRNQQQLIKDLFVQTVTALSEAVDAKDRYTSGHSKRVAEYARMIAALLGKSKEEQEEIYRAGLLHDIGKIRIPAEIINKPGKLTEEEYNTIKIHPVTGYHILRGISEDNSIAIAAKYHHERYDGKGYPNGLIGEKIPEVARILGVADSYDAMASNRSYRKALPQEVVRSEIEKGKGTQFDPKIADVMLQMMEEDTEYQMKEADSMQRRILLVDAQRENIESITEIMKDETQYEIVSAESGADAVKRMLEQEFDLILLDVRVPDMDGAELLRYIRENYLVPVVLMTGGKVLETATKFAELGCDDFITKPVLPLLVKEIVHNMTERTKF